VAITRIPIVVRDFDAVRQVAARLAPTVAQTFELRLEQRLRIAAIVAHQQQHEIQEHQFHRPGSNFFKNRGHLLYHSRDTSRAIIAPLLPICKAALAQNDSRLDARDNALFQE
jgi:hypothetical protein